jgi:hypothetical protein
VGDCCPFYLDVVIVIEIEEHLPGELGVIVGDDRVGDSKQKTMSWTKLTSCLEPILAKGLALIYLVNLSIMTSR